MKRGRRHWARDRGRVQRGMAIPIPLTAFSRGGWSRVPRVAGSRHDAAWPFRSLPKHQKNHGAPWTGAQVRELRQLAKQNTPTRVVALKMGRSVDSIKSKASEERISLKPTNKSPYGRQKA